MPKNISIIVIVIVTLIFVISRTDFSNDVSDTKNPESLNEKEAQKKIDDNQINYNNESNKIPKENSQFEAEINYDNPVTIEERTKIEVPISEVWEKPNESNKEEFIKKGRKLNGVNFNELNENQIDTLLDNYTMGSGEEFLNSYDQHTKVVSQSKNNTSDILQTLDGSFRSVVEGENPYFIDLNFFRGSLSIDLRNIDQVYYTHTFSNVEKTLRTGDAIMLPNIVIKLPPKKEFGYQHSLYLQLFISANEAEIIGTLYLTNQSLSEVNYIPSNKLIFVRI